MAFEVTMPQLGLTMEEGTVSRWLKQEGDTVKVGEVILDITTDKLTSEIESEHDGVLLKIVAEEGEDIPVKGILAYIGDVGESVNSSPQLEAVANAHIADTTDIEDIEDIEKPSAQNAKEVTVGKRTRISPLAKKTAAKMDVDYTGLKGSGPMGRIIQKDIVEASRKIASEPIVEKNYVSKPISNSSTLQLMEGDEIVKLAGMRKVVAERMERSAREIPTVTQNVKIDVTELMAFRKKINTDLNVKYSLNDYILKAVAKALKSNKHVLLSLDENNIIKRAHVNIGMAVALDEGLIVPVIKDADYLSLSEISAKAADLAQRARSNKLEMDEYKGSTFSISNLGMFGVETFNPIINQPDSGILGICAVNDELHMDNDGNITKRQFMRISYTFDHRLIDGATAAKFELAVKALLENPMQILL